MGEHLRQGSNIPEVHRRIKLLDSTTIALSLSPFPWATYQHEKGGIKLHTVLDFEQATPAFVHLTKAHVPDCIAAHEINLPKGCIETEKPHRSHRGSRRGRSMPMGTTIAMPMSWTEMTRGND